MKSETKKRVMFFLVGMAIATFVSVFVTFAFFEADVGNFVRNLIVTNAIFIILNLTWIRLHRRYGDMYKSGMEFEGGK